MSALNYKNATHCRRGHPLRDAEGKTILGALEPNGTSVTTHRCVLCRRMRDNAYNERKKAARAAARAAGIPRKRYPSEKKPRLVVAKKKTKPSLIACRDAMDYTRYKLHLYDLREREMRADLRMNITAQIESLSNTRAPAAGRSVGSAPYSEHTHRVGSRGRP